MEIGDKFLINWKGIKSTYTGLTLCKYKDKIFTISDFSKSRLSVYFYHNKTNNGCKCNICTEKDYLKSISIKDIIITQTKKQYERDSKLNKILYKKV
jgi:hypothetical protein